MTQVREPILCTCCGGEVMAEIVNDKLVIRKRIHGKMHVLLTDAPTTPDNKNQVTK